MNRIEKDSFNPLDYPEECQLYGAWMGMGQMSEDCLVATISDSTKRLLEQMHKSVDPLADISLIFKLNTTDDNDIFSVTGAWKCYGKKKGEKE